MDEFDSLQLVQQTYAAFGRGDLPAVLSHLSDDIIWNSQYPSGIPFGGQWQGHQAVSQFFMTLGTTLDVEDFTVENWIRQGDTVVVLGHEAARVKATGSEYRNDWVHVWTVKQGKVSEIKTYNDTATVAAAFRL